MTFIDRVRIVDPVDKTIKYITNAGRIQDARGVDLREATPSELERLNRWLSSRGIGEFALKRSWTMHA